MKKYFLTKTNALMLGIALIVFFGFLFCPHSTSVINENPPSNPPMWFVNFDDNRIDFKPPADLSQRFTKLVQNALSGKEPLKVLHIGDSHIQADFFTGETRKLLSSWIGDSIAARGFTFPYPIVGSNNPDDYDVTWKGTWIRNRPVANVQSKLGLAGISISTNDSISEFAISLKSKDKGIGRFDRVRIIFDSGNSGSVPIPKTEAILIHSDPHSVTYHLPNHADNIDFRFERVSGANHNFTLYGVELINTSAKLLYHAAGVNGASVRTFLQSENFSQIATSLDPHMVIVSLGTNDAYSPSFSAVDFSNDLTSFINQIKQALPNSIILLTTPGDHLVNRLHSNANIELAQEVIYKVAGKMDCGVWDFYRVMGGAGSINQWAELGLCAPDKLHLNRNGYKFQGALLFDALVRLSGIERNELLNHQIFND